ncbi:MAG: redoxin family protein [candidate division NC10 bacterium]|nr:redoxin family protein [candidate division NC10 bacterium]
MRILGIAVKGTPEEIRDFRKEFGAAYPVVADPEKKAFAAIGSPQATPHTYIIAWGEGRKRFIIDYHRGGVESPQPYLREIRKALKGELAGYDPGNKIPDLGALVNGKEVKLGQYKGKYLLLYLPAATTYSPAEDLRNNPNQVNQLKKIQAELKEKVMVFVLPQASLPEKEIRAALGSQVALLLDPDQALRASMGVKAEPLILVANEAGRITYRGSSITATSAQEIVEGKVQEPPHLAMSEEELRKRIFQAMVEINPKLTSVSQVKLESGEVIYVGNPPLDERKGYLFAKVVGKITLCDVCHDTHYFYVLDQEGIVRTFVPLSITKYGNEDWDAEDVKQIRSRVVGKSIFSTFPFDPKVDAVAMATMSSSLVYEGLNEGAHIFGDLKKFEFRADYWKAICFDNICRIKEAMKKAKAAAKGEWEYDPEVVAEYLPEKKLPLCPLEGMYAEFEDDILCSYHGLNLKGCK